MNTQLRYNYIDVVSADKQHSYGDSQLFSSDKQHFYGGSQLFFDGMIKRCGCSLIAAADVILYITGCHKPVSIEAYKAYIKQLAPAFPLVPYRGIPGIALALFLNIYLRRRRLPYSARFGRIGLIDEALKGELPVILCIGPGVHQFLKPKNERGLILYSAVSSDIKRVRSHFVVITARDGDLLTVSSWGCKYYISLSELRRYAALDLFGLFTNVIALRAL